VNVLLVGEAPNRADAEGRGNNDVLNAPAIVRKVPRILDFERRNVLPYWPGPDPRGKGSLFPMAEARKHAERLWRRYPRKCAFVIFSARAAEAFGIRRRSYDFCEWIVVRGREVVVIPHPSGIVQWWNSESNRQKVKYLMEIMIPHPSKIIQ
jgi:hypothetical protein